MRLGLIARADKTGLGHQTLEMYRAMKPHKTLVIDLTSINRQMGKETTFHPEWYPDAAVKQFPLTAAAIDEFLDDLDVVFTCETPYNHYLFEAARVKGIKTVRQFNYEFLDYLHDPELPKPDVLLAPSKWYWSVLQNYAKEWNVELRYLPVPVATDRFTPKVKTKSRRFIHIAGHPTAGDRNGTEIVREAVGMLKTDAEIVIKEPTDNTEYWELYDGDVLIIPRSYGGLSLQVQEARAAGMVTMVGQHDPYAEGSIQLAEHPEEPIFTRPNVEIQRRKVYPNEVARWVDKLYLKDISNESKWSIKWAEDHSWDKLKPVYQSLLEDLCEN